MFMFVKEQLGCLVKIASFWISGCSDVESKLCNIM